MQLFNQRIISRAISDTPHVQDHHREVLSRWANGVRSGAIRSQSEVALHADFKSRIVETVLGYRPFGSADGQTVAAEEKMGAGKVDLALGFFGEDEPKIIAPFELKGGKTSDLDAPMPGRNKTPVEQAWEYATASAGVRWVLVTNYLEIRLYSYAEGRGEYERFDLGKIDEPEEYASAMLLLSADNLLGGRTEELLKQSKSADKEISEQLYADYRQLREMLIAYIQKVSDEADKVEAVSVGQKILDRVLFIAFAEDNGLLPDRTLNNAFAHRDPYNPRPVWDNFKGLFSAIDAGNETLGIPRYNGGLFEADPRIDALELPDDLCKGFRRLGGYDFGTEIGVTILGRIFEQSIADLERLLARARGELEEEPKKTGASGRRKRDGIVYTPDYIARFIVERTLGTHLGEMFRETMAQYAKGDPADYDSLQFAQGSERGKKRWNERELKAWTDYRYRLQSLRVVDPACGSGVFLVMAFDFLKTEYDRVNKKMAELRGAPDLFDPDSEILSQNLYGVDVNAESIEITRLSLWLKTARRGKVLDSLDHTIRVGDSLIEDSNFAYLEHGFNWRDAFPEVFADGGFDVVLGNPPYVRQELISGMKPYLQRRFEVYNGVADLYTYFFERGLRLLKPGGRLGYISSSTFFKTGSGAPLRRYLLQNAAIETVTDFGDLQVFEGVTTYPAILTMRKTEDVTGNELRFWKLESVPDDNFSAAFDELAQSYPQGSLGEGSWELESPSMRALRDKIKAGKATLKEAFGIPYRGILTGLNEAFIIDRTTRDKLVAEDPTSSAFLKPWLEGKDLKRWVVESRDLWLILFPKGWTKKKYGNLEDDSAWQAVCRDFPAISSHLQIHEERGKKRADQGDYWWELRACDYYKEFQGKKIVYRELANMSSFSIDVDHLLDTTCYILPEANPAHVAYLNSNVFWFIFRSLTPTARGGFNRLKRQYVQDLPAPNLPTSFAEQLTTVAEACQKAAEERYRRQEAVRRRIPDLCPAGNDKVKREADGAPKLTNKLKEWWALDGFDAFRAEVKKTFKADIPLAERSDWEDWLKKEKAEIDRLSAEIARNENEINAIVYRLFDLSNDEIELLEANI